MRQAAISTMASTAGLSTANTEASSGSCPQSAYTLARAVSTNIEGITNSPPAIRPPGTPCISQPR